MLNIPIRRVSLHVHICMYRTRFRYVLISQLYFATFIFDLCVISGTSTAHTKTCSWKMNQDESFSDGLKRHLISGVCVHRLCSVGNCGEYVGVDHFIIHRAVEELLDAFVPFFNGALPAIDIDLLVSHSDNTLLGRARVVGGLRRFLRGLNLLH